MFRLAVKRSRATTSHRWGCPAKLTEKTWRTLCTGCLAGVLLLDSPRDNLPTFPSQVCPPHDLAVHCASPFIVHRRHRHHHRHCHRPHRCRHRRRHRRCYRSLGRRLMSFGPPRLRRDNCPGLSTSSYDLLGSTYPADTLEAEEVSSCSSQGEHC